MRRRALVAVDAPDDAVRAALRADLALADDAGVLRGALPGGDAVAARTTVRLLPAEEPGRTLVEVEGETDVSVPYFRWFVHPLLAALLRRGNRYVVDTVRASFDGAAPPSPPRPSPFLPRVAFTPDQAAVLATVAMVAAVCGFAGALIGQNLDFLARAFHVSNDQLGVALAVTRLGVLVGLVATALADRHGRRRLMLVSLVGVCVSSGLSAVSPSLPVFTGAQFLTRGFLNAALVVAAIVAVEEAPEGARAFSLAMTSLAGGAGYALSVVLLPLGDVASGTWRIPFAVSALSVVLVPHLARRLPETQRYARVVAAGTRRGRFSEVLDPAYGSRFWMLGAVAFLANVLAAPAAQFTNRFLSDERGFSGFDIAVFRSITNGIPGIVGILLAGRLAERAGRRPTAVVGLAAAALLNAAFFLGHGAVLWLASTVGIVAAACAGIALGVLDAELFPTEVRGTSNGMLLVCGVAGSAVGLLLAGALSDPLGALGRAVALCAVAPLVAALLLVPRLPESATLGLDEVSPPE